MSKYIFGPRVTLVSKPVFIEPEHLQVRRLTEEAPDGEKLIEYAGRICYMSHNNPADRSTAEYVDNILQQAHGSVLEHANYSLLIEGISRTCSHELVRHRAGFAYSQVSQRFVNVEDADIVVPPAIVDNTELWEPVESILDTVTKAYNSIVNGLVEIFKDSSYTKVGARKAAREAARSVMLNCTETKLVMTGNARSWRHFLQMRGSEHADREICRLAVAIYRELSPHIPAVLNDFSVYINEHGYESLKSSYIKV